jgi:hypothetical protein
MEKKMGSKKFKLNAGDLWSLAKTSIFVGAAASLTFIGENLAGMDFGNAGALLVPVVALVIDAGVKWLKDNSKTDK